MIRSGRTVAVIGAGPSGLATTKELTQEGHSVICLERARGLGGVFNYRPSPQTVSVWKSCRLTSSVLVTSFSDYFPQWKSAVPYQHTHMTHSEYVAYLTGYAEHFDILKCIRFGSEVSGVARRVDGGWTVRFRSIDDRRARELHVDAVAVCTGLHRVPHVPDLPGLQQFEGQVLHAASYRCPASLDGRSALFVGGGESGSEIIAEATRHLERAYVSLRRGAFVIPRLLNGLPNDYTGTRLLYSLPAILTRSSDPETRELKRRLHFALLPLSLARTALVQLQRAWRKRSGAARARRVSLRRVLGRRRSEAVLEAEEIRTGQVFSIIHALRDCAGGNQFETFATKSEGLAVALAEGRCELRPDVERFTTTGVIFGDGEEVCVDTVVLCTGYQSASAPFLDVPVDLDRLYKNCFDPATGRTLAFVGFVRPPLGAIPPMAEMQARWLAQLLSEKVSLPSEQQMRVEAQGERSGRETYYHRIFRRLPHIVDFSSYLDDLAEIVGCKPRLSDCVTHPKLLYKLYTAPFCAAQYRLRGPHARPEMARKLLLFAPSQVLFVRFVDLALASLASLVGIERFKPHLTLRARRRPSTDKKRRV